MPPVPERIQKLPVQMGYPVPWFVAEIDGKYDFRVVDPRKMPIAVHSRVCWICGQKLGNSLAFTIGPMCAINRVISEPPSHRECAEFAMKACPFLNQSQVKRNTKKIGTEVSPAAGHHIERQPGVMCLWITKTYEPFDAGNGVLFSLGEPDQVFWYSHGRPATRIEVAKSIETGLPELRAESERLGSIAVVELEAAIRKVQPLLPPEIAARKMFGSAARRF